MTIETLKKAKKINDEINTMSCIYDIIQKDDCIRVINEEGYSMGISNDPGLIRAFKSEILRRRTELVEELERM